MNQRQLTVPRRTVLRGLGATAAAGLTLAGTGGCAAIRRTPKPPGDPFQLGVASGCPTPDGFVLWTRLAPDPLCPDPAMPGGMTAAPTTVRYEIARDSGLRDIVRRGEAGAPPELAHSVHVEIAGLEPGRPYWYRFAWNGAASRIGCARTSPAPGAALDRLRFGFVSCANYEQGYFAAYRHLADEQPDLVLFLGDYLYEYAAPKAGTVRQHSDGVEATDLHTYRNRHAQYRLDPDLQRLHAEVPALVTWDDHEVRNDYADRWSPDGSDPATFLVRRAAAYQAFYEHMPLRPSRSRPDGPAMQLYDHFAFGNLVQIALLDGRQYRSRLACDAPPSAGGAHVETLRRCPDLARPERSLLGTRQEAWLAGVLGASPARWNLLAQDVLMAPMVRPGPDGGRGYWTDNWDGYAPARARLLQFLDAARIANPVVLSGDIHAFLANDLRRQADAATPPVATEFVCTSISARPGPYERFARMLPDNPHIRFFESRRRGYAIADATANALAVRFRAVSDAADPAATVSTLASFATEAGRPGVQAG